MTGFVRKFRKKNSMGWVRITHAGRYRSGTKLLASLRKAAHLSSICRSVEGVNDAPSEANFKTKASKQGPTGIGGRWIVILTRKRRLRSPQWAGSEYANVKHRRWQSS